jgi:chromosomal replication initiator protein
MAVLSLLLRKIHTQILLKRYMMNQEFPFGHFLGTGEKSDKNQIVNAISSKFLPNQLAPNEPKSAQNDSSLSNDELSLFEKELLSQIKNIVPAQKFELYFESSFSLTQIIDGSIIFKVPSNFIKNVIEGQFLDIISEAVRMVLGKALNVQIELQNGEKVSPSLDTKPKKPKSVKEVHFNLNLNHNEEDKFEIAESKYIQHTKPITTGISISPSKTFDNFIVGLSNHMAVSSSQAVAKRPGDLGKYQILYIFGDSGLGKTHLLHAIANTIIDQYPEKVICLITGRDFMSEIVSGFAEKNIEAVRERFSKIDVLMIDDIHEIAGGESTQNEFFHIFNKLKNNGKQVVFTSDKSPDKLVGLEDRLKTRLNGGLVQDIQKPDLETRIAILRKKAIELDLYLQDDVINFIASSVKSSIRELEGTLIKLSAISELLQTEIDLKLVKERLYLEQSNESKQITIEQITKSAAKYFGISVADIKSKSRHKDFTRPRHIAMYLARKVLNAKQEEIGRFFGGRDHSSVIHAVNKIEEKIRTDKSLSKDVINIENAL